MENSRVCLPDSNEVELTNAREVWKRLSDAGVETVYWAEVNEMDRVLVTKFHIDYHYITTEF